MEKSTHSPKIYALLVGINKYPTCLGISNLFGCVGDVERIDDFLSEQVNSRYQYESKLLRNEQATRKQVITDFRTHLGKAIEEDVVLFMYAGHGSRQPSAVEFNDRNPDQMDETLVCYDSRLPGGLDLADKELAVLISELKAGHVVVILDSCHSGSGTRDGRDVAGMHIRSTIPVENPRELGSYLYGHYAKQLAVDQMLSVPLRPHILLAACARHEYAAEHFSGYGYFSNSLLTVLKADGLDLGYDDLFLRCRIAIKKDIISQTPQFECYAGDDPQATFLNIVDATPKRLSSHHAYIEAGRWYINLGALHDLLADSRQTSIVTIDDISNTPIDVPLKCIGPERSELLIPAEIQMPASGTTPAILRMFTRLPGLVLLTTAKSITDIIHQNWLSSLNLAVTEDPSIADFQLHETEKGLELFDLLSGQLLQHSHQRNAQGVVALMLTLKKVLIWQRFRRLSNSSMEDRFAAAKVSFSLIDTKGNEIDWPTHGKALPYPQNESGEIAYYPICHILNNTTKKLFFNLFYLSRNYGIELLEWKEITPSHDWVKLWGKYDGDGLFLPAGINASTEIFKVIISTEQTQTWLIAQAGFEVGAEVRGMLREMHNRSLSAMAEWVARGFELKLVRKVGS